MTEYEYPIFNFSAPFEYAMRAEPIDLGKPGYRSEFMRDRDRVMYCGAFRRLGGKTQIYLTGKDDHQRNRLTHTLEVSQIARTVSQALGLDCDLTEAIALGHDLGHTPFGHAGEAVLHEIMVPKSKINVEGSPLQKKVEDDLSKNMLGFKHNVQSLRIAASIEDNYGKTGLNLTNYTLWGILHHSSIDYKPGRVETAMIKPNYINQYNRHLCMKDYPDRDAWSFEAFVVREADEIAQWHHDLEDALRSGAMSGADVCGTVQRNLGKIMDPEDSANLDKLKERSRIDRKYIADLSHIVVNTLVNRLIECSMHNLNHLWQKYVKDTTKRLNFFVEHNWSESEIQEAIKLRKIGDDSSDSQEIEVDYSNTISEKIHHSREVERMNAKGRYIIKKLFQAYYSHPQQLPDSIIIRYMVAVEKYDSLQSAEQMGMGAVRVEFEKLRADKSVYGIDKQLMLMRSICDHIAGMTDHYAMEEYNNLYG